MLNIFKPLTGRLHEFWNMTQINMEIKSDYDIIYICCDAKATLISLGKLMRDTNDGT
jgi:hypothetical protein